MDYTVESANRLAAELRDLREIIPAQRRLDKQGMVRLLAEEMIGSSNGATRLKTSLRACVARPRYHDAHAEKLSPASKGKAEKRSKEQASGDQAGGPRCGARDAEARQGGPLRCGGSEHATRAEAADRRARTAAGSRSRSAPQRQGGISRQGQGQLLNERIAPCRKRFFSLVEARAAWASH